MIVSEEIFKCSYGCETLDTMSPWVPMGRAKVSENSDSLGTTG